MGQNGDICRYSDALGRVRTALRYRVLLLFSLVMTCTVQAETYRVGVEEQSYFPRYGHHDGQYSGYARELLDAFAADMGIEFDYVSLPEEALTEGLLNENLDFRYPDNPGWYLGAKPKEGLFYSRPLDFTLVGLLVPPEREGQKALRTLALQQGFKTDLFAEQLKTGTLTLFPAAKQEHLAIIGEARLVDAVYADPYVIQYHLRRQGGRATALVLDHSYPYALHNYSLSTLRHPQLIQELDRWFKNHYDLVLRLRRKYEIIDI